MLWAFDLFVLKVHKEIDKKFTFHILILNSYKRLCICPDRLSYALVTNKPPPGVSDDKESVCNAGDLGWIPRMGRSPGGEHVNPLQSSCLEDPHGQRSLAGYSSWGCKESYMTEWLSTHMPYWLSIGRAYFSLTVTVM